MTPLLSDDDLAALAAARGVLRDFQSRLFEQHREWTGGMCYSLAYEAEHAIFQVLNWTSSYGVQSLTHEQMHTVGMVAPDAAA